MNLLAIVAVTLRASNITAKASAVPPVAIRTVLAVAAANDAGRRVSTMDLSRVWLTDYPSAYIAVQAATRASLATLEARRGPGKWVTLTDAGRAVAAEVARQVERLVADLTTPTQNRQRMGKRAYVEALEAQLAAARKPGRTVREVVKRKPASTRTRPTAPGRADDSPTV